MTSLFYKIVQNYGELRKCSGRGCDLVRVHIEGESGGIISIGEVSARVKSGYATLSLRPLSDGVYTPIYCDGGRTLRLEPLKKTRSEIMGAEPRCEMLRRLAERTELVEQKLAELEDRCAAFELAINGEPILGSPSEEARHERRKG